MKGKEFSNISHIFRVFEVCCWENSTYKEIRSMNPWVLYDDLGTVLQKCESSQISVQTSVHCLKALIWNDAPVKPISYGNSTSSGVWCSWVAAASNAGGERQGVSSGDPWGLSPEPEDTWNPEVFVQKGMETQNQLDLWKPFWKSGKSIKRLELCLLQVEKGELQTHALELNGPGRESCSCHRPRCGVWEMLSHSCHAEEFPLTYLEMRTLLPTHGAILQIW